MTSSGTRTTTFTITDARYIGAKVAADLHLLNSLYGRPALASIDDYADEVAVLLHGGYLNTVDYGFKDHSTNAWKLRLRYTATIGGHLVDDRPGSFPANATVVGYPFYSYLTYSDRYHALTTAEQTAVTAGLVITRVGADEPTTGSGTNTSGHGYGRHGTGVARNVFVAA